MGITQEQNIPEKSPEPKGKWTVRSLLGVRGILTAVSKDFKPIELAFIFMVIITGLGEIIGRNFTWMWYSILAITIVSVFLLHIPRAEQNKDKNHANKS